MSEIHSGTVEERVKKCIAEHMDITADHIKNFARLDHDLGLDSLRLLEVVMAIEDEFGIEIYDEAAWAFTTVQSVIDHVTAKVRA